MPERIQLSRAKGWRMPENTVKVARPTVYGNLYRIGDKGVPDAEVAVYRYRLWLETTPGGQCSLASIKRHLRGKNLACWCRPGQPCHADVLLELANA